MTRTFLLFILLFALPVMASGQTKQLLTSDKDTIKPYGKDYHKPRFRGGDDSLKVFIQKNLRYPPIARESNIQGKVVVRFLVDEKGAISHISLVRGIYGACDEEAKRVVQAMPAWEPAIYKKRPVRAVEVLPLEFRLE